MARSPAQRGRIGVWLVQARLSRGYSTQAEARREIERLTGWRIPQSQYAEWESGRRVPSEGSLERLEAFYGAPASEPPIAGQHDLIAAVDRLTAQMARIEARLEAQAGAMDGWADGLQQLLTQLVAEHVHTGAVRERQTAAKS